MTYEKKQRIHDARLAYTWLQRGMPASDTEAMAAIKRLDTLSARGLLEIIGYLEESGTSLSLGRAVDAHEITDTDGHARH